MHDALDRLAMELDLLSPARESLRLAFAHACVERVRGLLESAEVMACLDTLAAFVRGEASGDSLRDAAARAADLAGSHPGSKSIDGCGHAAVSASYAVANALAGRPLQAASYAAYAVVYAQGGSAAVADRESFEPEFAWQRRCLRQLASEAS